MAVSELMLAIEGTWKQQGLVWESWRMGCCLGALLFAGMISRGVVVLGFGLEGSLFY